MTRSVKLRVMLSGVECMRRKKRSFWFLLISILSLTGLSYLVYSFPPNYQLQITNYKLNIIFIFSFLIFIFFTSLFSFILNNKRRGLFFGLFVLTILVLRLNRLLHPFFLILLLAFFITLELLFNSRKK